MHQAAIRSLGLVEDKLRGNLPEKKLTHRREKQKEEVKRKSSRNETSESSEDEKRQKRKKDARNIIAQARVNNYWKPRRILKGSVRADIPKHGYSRR
jgi:hypothetical protein